MAWHVDVASLATTHYGDGDHRLSVRRDGSVRIWRGGPFPSPGMHYAASLGTSSQKGKAFVEVLTPNGWERSHAAAPSENLQQLIAQHHLHPDQWPILLDALQEEYPQLHEAIEAHHAARRSSEAEQYARAFASAAK